MAKRPGAEKRLERDTRERGKNRERAQSTEEQREMAQSTEEQREMEKMLKDLCSASEAAEILGVDESRVRRLARDGRIAARKIDTIWIVHKPSLNKYLKSKSKRGRPPGPVQYNKSAT